MTTGPTELRFQLTPRDLAEANVAHFRSSRISYLFLLVGFVNLAVAGYQIAQHPAAVGTYLLPLLFGLAFAFGFPLLLRLSAPAAFRRQPALGAEVLMRVTDDGLAVSGGGVAGEERWSVYTAYLQTRNLFVLYSGPRTFRVVPRRAFPDADSADAFGQMVADKVGRVRREWVM